ncbi:hypothetical protein Pint_11552 [Pistacia integerrima]|uniref:Uncharacterized protein n=1 Tax=Pistacia integerrima TaxID=434235 RepID=A0ACC0XK53_9ROSI|nr:hypothetical protein Pint_11552 [Pistacia integerrima]
MFKFRFSSKPKASSSQSGAHGVGVEQEQPRSGVRNTYMFVHKNNSTAEEIAPGVPRPSGLDLFGRNNHLASSLPGANGDGVEQEEPRNGVRNTYMFVHDDNSTVEEISPGVPRPSALDLFGPKNHLAVSAAQTKNEHPSTLKLFAKRKK